MFQADTEFLGGR